MSKVLKLAVTGFGNVGRNFCKMVTEQGQKLADNYGYEIKFTAIATRSRGTVINPEGLDIGELLDMYDKNDKFCEDYPHYASCDVFEMLKKSGADVFVELTTLSLDGGQPAASYMEKAFELGMHVITANKGPLVFHYNKLSKMAEEKGLCFLYETTVNCGCPVFNLARHSLQGCEILGFRGILNGSTNFILTLIEQGNSFEDAVKEAQRIGFAEADPSMDVDGWDGCVKLCTLANVLMGEPILPDMVDVQTMTTVTREDIEHAKAEGFKIKYLCKAEYVDGKLVASVKPTKIPMSDPFASANNTSMALTLYTDLDGEINVIQNSPNITNTAYGVLNDLITVIKTLG